MKMQKRVLLSILVWSAVMILTSRCIEPFEIKGLGSNQDILVVDATLSSPENVATVKLSRALPLDSIGSFPPEMNAVVMIEDNDGNEVSLNHTSSGIYSNALPLDQSKQYRLIIEVNQKTYQSDFVSPQRGIEIDSIVWRGEQDALAIKVNAHGNTTDSRYFKYSFTETWRYTAFYYSMYIVDKPGEVRPREANEGNYVCYSTEDSRSILVTTTKQLSENRVQEFKIQDHAIGSIKTSSVYSILVKQTAISEAEYSYLVDVRNSTNPEGGLFDPQPGRVVGNIRCVSDPDENVIGFFGIGASAEKRLLFFNSDLPDRFRRGPQELCELQTIPVSQVENIVPPFYVTTSFGIPFIEGYYYSNYSCTDCRSKGGTTTKPDYFPQ